MGKTKTKKFRGSGRHGRGRKGGRGKGLRGGKGNAGLHKHKYATTVKWQNEGYFHFGRRGMKPVEVQGVADEVINVGDIFQRWPTQSSIDLGAHGITKLLGAGDVPKALTVKVETASAGAIAKVQKAGGKVETSRTKKVPKPPAAKVPAPGGKLPPPPAAKPAAPAAAKSPPANKPPPPPAKKP